MAKMHLAHRLIIIFCLLGTAIFTASNPVSAAFGLANLSDVLNTTLSSWPAQHKISFTLPSDSFPIKTSDYIQIYLAEFTNVSASVIMSGTFDGDPVTVVDGNFVRITNVTVPPGGTVYIDGISATNPPNEDWQYVFVVMVTEDAAGTIVKNIANGVATLNRASVTVSATIEEPLAGLTISGYTAPYTFLVFTESGSVIGTDYSGPNGAFIHVFSGLQPTTHNINMYGLDADNLITSTIPIIIYTPAYQQTSISNLLLSPTLQVSSTRLDLGADLVASGSALPNGDITVFTDIPMRSYQLTASSSGLWNYTIDNTDEYVLGDYRIYAMVQDSFGLQSLMSNSINFSVVASGSATGTACGDLSHGDLNCDDLINLTDFSILMYYWGTADATADVNTDALVNLTDFSIMMFWWGT